MAKNSAKANAARARNLIKARAAKSKGTPPKVKTVNVGGKRMNAKEYAAYRKARRNVRLPWPSDIVPQPVPSGGFKGGDPEPYNHYRG